jgi:hypothetical protein
MLSRPLSILAQFLYRGPRKHGTRRKRGAQLHLPEEIWKEMAGPVYSDLVQSKEKALANLFHADSNVRTAAIHICDSFWNYGQDIKFVNACRKIAAADPVETVRAHAILSFGKAYQSSKDLSASQFLADIVMDNGNSFGLRMAAYWALREIQIGLTEEDTVKRAFSLIKLGVRKLAMGLSEEDAKTKLLGAGDFPRIDWDSVDQIDFDFVIRFASPK